MFILFDRTWHTGSTIISGFLSDLAALMIMARAWFKLSVFLDPILPNCIKARVKDLSLGAGVANVMVVWSKMLAKNF